MGNGPFTPAVERLCLSRQGCPLFAVVANDGRDWSSPKTLLCPAHYPNKNNQPGGRRRAADILFLELIGDGTGVHGGGHIAESKTEAE